MWFVSSYDQCEKDVDHMSHLTPASFSRLTSSSSSGCRKDRIRRRWRRRAWRIEAKKTHPLTKRLFSLCLSTRTHTHEHLAFTREAIKSPRALHMAGLAGE